MRSSFTEVSRRDDSWYPGHSVLMVSGVVFNDAVNCQNYIVSTTDKYDGKPEVLGETRFRAPICP
jgi:hypothetical protein